MVHPHRSLALVKSAQDGIPIAFPILQPGLESRHVRSRILCGARGFQFRVGSRGFVVLNDCAHRDDEWTRHGQSGLVGVANDAGHRAQTAEFWVVAHGIKLHHRLGRAAFGKPYPFVAYARGYLAVR